MTGKQTYQYYAVKVGRSPGIHLTWEECRKQVDRFSGAIHQGFDTLEEAQAFIRGTPTNSKSNTALEIKTKAKTKELAYSSFEEIPF